MSSLRDVQLSGLKILNAVDEICRKHDLSYHLNWGTLLGAIRHKGFIPWDNDIDISMPVSDYRKFLQIAQKELPSGLFLQTYLTDRGYNELWAKVHADGTTALPLIMKNWSVHRGISIDVFPLVGWANTSFGRKLQNRAFGLCRTLLAKEYMEATDSPELNNPPWKLRLILGLPWHVRVWLCVILEHIAFRRVNPNGQVALVDMVLNEKVPAKYYESCNVVFEGKEYPAPAAYDQILTMHYGDYMTPPPPEERGRGHELFFGQIIYDSEKDYREYLKELGVSE